MRRQVLPLVSGTRQRDLHIRAECGTLTVERAEDVTLRVCEVADC